MEDQVESLIEAKRAADLKFSKFLETYERAETDPPFRYVPLPRQAAHSRSSSSEHWTDRLQSTLDAAIAAAALDEVVTRRIAHKARAAAEISVTRRQELADYPLAP